MQYIILALATAASFASAQSSVSTPSASASPTGAVVPVGGNCTPGITQCALGSSCYATNSMLQPRCGNFQATCTSDQQCAFNTCNLQQGLCNGFLSSSSSSSASSAPATITSTPAGGYSPAPSSTVTAPAGSLPIGAECNALANPSQCVAGVQCWASNSGLIARCGNFNAACSSNAQCAYNTCNNGLCNGFLPSSAGNVTMTVYPTGSSRPIGSATQTGSATATTSMAQFTGAASVVKVANGVIAVVFGAVAWVL
ncbi:uncharacterized protein EKO05_0002062 [Ascochyta rabiei]|uniref:Uncharacterized protein n=1 Tax=Didymella rabiei TaxID=5454 RepID=A0A163C473_DIDRA|nr:uncharacterized protein EKO05_0002062 [Ascochyta rabiei]KZM22195.1 hypothetical protein ST47_g6628 [Ascochyta rabiei]UPX11456.1 hypothetical protein EKO05_0002062 [Ascochyta rabiei]